MYGGYGTCVKHDMHEIQKYMLHSHAYTTLDTTQRNLSSRHYPIFCFLYGTKTHTTVLLAFAIIALQRMQPLLKILAFATISLPTHTTVTYSAMHFHYGTANSYDRYV